MYEKTDFVEFMKYLIQNLQIAVTVYIPQSQMLSKFSKHIFCWLTETMAVFRLTMLGC